MLQRPLTSNSGVCHEHVPHIVGGVSSDEVQLHILFGCLLLPRLLLLLVLCCCKARHGTNFVLRM